MFSILLTYLIGSFACLFGIVAGDAAWRLKFLMPNLVLTFGTFVAVFGFFGIWIVGEYDAQQADMYDMHPDWMLHMSICGFMILFGIAVAIGNVSETVQRAFSRLYGLKGNGSAGE